MSHYYPVGLRQDTLNHLFSGIRLSDRLVFQPFWRVENVQLLRYLIENEFLEKDDVAVYAHEWLMRCGKDVYDSHKRTQVPPYLLSSPMALGYWLRNGGFEKLPFLERKRINFDGDEIRESYESMAENLLSDVVEQLLAIPEPSVEIQSSAGDVCFCEGCPVD